MNASDSPRNETPEYHRARYLELKAQAKEANSRRVSAQRAENPREIRQELIIVQDLIPGGRYWSRRLPRGNSLRIANELATHGVSVLLWNAADPSERYNPADTVKVQWTARIGAGKLLFSDMGRVLASITADTCGMHDCIAGGSTPESNARKYGEDLHHRNTRDNFLLAAGKHGLDPRDVGPCITFFAPVTIDSTGQLIWRYGAIRMGDYVDLRAEMDLLVALSNCPHPLSPEANFEARPVRAMLWRSPPAAADDFCRTVTEEAVRAFENTDAVLAS
jgi:urea carboxylase-associated protein 2